MVSSANWGSIKQARKEQKCKACQKVVRMMSLFGHTFTQYFECVVANAENDMLDGRVQCDGEGLVRLARNSVTWGMVTVISVML